MKANNTVDDTITEIGCLESGLESISVDYQRDTVLLTLEDPADAIEIRLTPGQSLQLRGFLEKAENGAIEWVVRKAILQKVS